ncbi:hypothetical protein [Haloglomus litoreum]|uniref:hypothetical protein n=1 Tax=Haloglomus litoreum TaxID=3034026 RepID=UPI0023E8B362|nr:hypothetical protein [Haloglomus sp. DT116]
MAASSDRDGLGWLRAVQGSQVSEVLARGGDPLDAADLYRIRSVLRGGVLGAAVAADALAVLLFTGEVLTGRVALVAGGICVVAFLAGYAVQIRAIARCYRTLPGGVAPVAVATATLPAGVALGILSALAVVVPFGVVRTLLLLGVGVGAAALTTCVALGVVCQRAAVRQTRRPSTGPASPNDSPSAVDD